MNERGGAFVGFLAAVGFFAIVMVVVFASCISGASSQGRSLARLPAVAYDDGGGDGYGDGGSYGNGNDQRKCYRGENCRGSFSPGPFDRSPVDVHDNCVSLDCSGSAKTPPGQGRQPPKDSRRTSA